MYVEINSADEKENVLLIGSKVDLLFAGVAEVKNEAIPGGIHLYSCIDLYYPDDSLPVVLAIAKEMDRLKQHPIVYIDRKQDRFYIAVVFEFTVQSLEFLMDVATPTNAQNLKELNYRISNHGLKIIMTGEAELGRPVDAFLNLYKEKSCYAVLISRNTGDPHKPITLWHATLTSFIPGMLCEW